MIGTRKRGPMTTLTRTWVCPVHDVRWWGRPECWIDGCHARPWIDWGDGKAHQYYISPATIQDQSHVRAEIHPESEARGL